jgi:hypothetical protein
MKEFKKGFKIGSQEKRYNDLDKAYYAAKPQLATIVEAYIRSHLSEFR